MTLWSRSDKIRARPAIFERGATRIRCRLLVAISWVNLASSLTCTHNVVTAHRRLVIHRGCCILGQRFGLLRLHRRNLEGFRLIPCRTKIGGTTLLFIKIFIIWECFLWMLLMLMLSVALGCLSAGSRLTTCPLGCRSTLLAAGAVFIVRSVVYGNTLLTFWVFSKSFLFLVITISIIFYSSKVRLTVLPRIGSSAIRLWSTIYVHGIIPFVLLHLPHIGGTVRVISRYQYGDYVIFKQKIKSS